MDNQTVVWIVVAVVAVLVVVAVVIAVMRKREADAAAARREDAPHPRRNAGRRATKVQQRETEAARDDARARQSRGKRDAGVRREDDRETGPDSGR